MPHSKDRVWLEIEYKRNLAIAQAYLESSKAYRAAGWDNHANDDQEFADDYMSDANKLKERLDATD